MPALKGLKRSAAAICYYRRSRLPFARPEKPKTIRGSFDQVLMPQPSATIGVRGCRLPAPQRPKTLRGSFDQARNPQPSATIRVRGCRLRALKGLKPSAEASIGSVDQALRPQPSATIGVRGCRLAALKGLKGSTAASTRHAGHSHLLLSAFEAAVCLPSKA